MVVVVRRSVGGLAFGTGGGRIKRKEREGFTKRDASGCWKRLDPSQAFSATTIALHSLLGSATATYASSRYRAEFTRIIGRVTRQRSMAGVADPQTASLAPKACKKLVQVVSTLAFSAFHPFLHTTVHLFNTMQP